MKLELDDIIHMQETKLTIRGSRRRTTIPGEIIDFFELKDGDSIRWVLLKNSTITILPNKKRNKK